MRLYSILTLLPLLFILRTSEVHPNAQAMIEIPPEPQTTPINKTDQTNMDAAAGLNEGNHQNNQKENSKSTHTMEGQDGVYEEDEDDNHGDAKFW